MLLWLLISVAAALCFLLEFSRTKNSKREKIDYFAFFLFEIVLITLLTIFDFAVIKLLLLIYHHLQDSMA